MNQLPTAAPASGAVENTSAAAGTAAEAPIYDLARFTLADMVRCGSALRRIAGEAASMEEAAQKITRYLYDHLRDQTSNRHCCALVRLFRTLAYSELDPELRAFADSMAAGANLAAATGCLTLLGSAGDQPQWNWRRDSRAHRCIPLGSQALIEKFPMISQLIRKLGLTVSEFLRAGPEIVREMEQKQFGVFYVSPVLGSPYVPAQAEFAVPYKIASVLGVGGVLPDGDMFALIMFSRTNIPGSTAEMFRTIALNLKLGFLELLDKPVLIN
jgi:hypothetical protein